jgi:hypothetical protein
LTAIAKPRDPAGIVDDSRRRGVDALVLEDAECIAVPAGARLYERTTVSLRREYEPMCSVFLAVPDELRTRVPERELEELRIEPEAPELRLDQLRVEDDRLELLRPDLGSAGVTASNRTRTDTASRRMGHSVDRTFEVFNTPCCQMQFELEPSAGRTSSVPGDDTRQVASAQFGQQIFRVANLLSCVPCMMH